MNPVEEVSKLIDTSGPPQNVLVVEDHKAYAGFLFDVISGLRVACKVVYSPIVALQEDISQFTTAIVDWNFPGQMTGIQCGICLRDRNPEIKIIIHTGFTDVTIAEKCRLLGFDIIPKPS